MSHRYCWKGFRHLPLRLVPPRRGHIPHIPGAMLHGLRPRLWSCSCGRVWAAAQAAAPACAGSPGWGKAQHPLQRAAGLRGRWARSLVVLVSQAVGGSWVQGRDRLLCSPAHGVAARPERSLLHRVPNDFCAELPWYSLSISVFDLLRFCRMADSHHQDTVRLACGPLLGGESLSVSPA